MPAKSPAADFVEIERGRLVSWGEDIDRGGQNVGEPLLEVEDSRGCVTLIGRITLGGTSGPISGWMRVEAACSGKGASPVLVTVALYRPSIEGYEDTGGEQALISPVRALRFPVRLQAGPRGHFNAHGEVQLCLRFSKKLDRPTGGGYVVTVRSVTFERESALE
jgi:hypothetical protein